MNDQSKAMQEYLKFFTGMTLDKVYSYTQLMRLDRPIGILLLLWPTLVALWVASNGFPPVDLFLIFSLGAVVMRSAGCVINDYLDRDFDGHVSRTQSRPLVAGSVTPQEAIVLLLCLLLVALILVSLIDLHTLYWAIGAACMTLFYPLAKRFTWLPQVVLGMTFAWGIPMAFSAAQHQVTELTWLIYFTNLIWIVMYDTLYAMVDREDDLRVGIKSTAVLFADADRLLIGIMQGMTLAGLIILAMTQGYSWFYYLMMLVIASLFGWQQWLIRAREPASCFKAFLNNNYVGLAWFFAIVVEYLA